MFEFFREIEKSAERISEGKKKAVRRVLIILSRPVRPEDQGSASCVRSLTLQLSRSGDSNLIRCRGAVSGSLAGNRRSSARASCIISGGSRNGQFNFRARPDVAPKLHVASYELRSFADSRKTKVAGTPFALQQLRVHTFSVITDSQTQLVRVISNFHFNSIRLCVMKCIAQHLRHNSVRFVVHNGVELPRCSFHCHLHNGSGSAGFGGSKIFSDRPNCDGEIVGDYGRGSQALYRIPSLCDRLTCLLDGTVKGHFGLVRTCWQKMRRCLKAEQQPVKALQERVMQVPCDARPLVDSCVQCDAQLMAQLLKPKLINKPKQ